MTDTIKKMVLEQPGREKVSWMFTMWDGYTGKDIIARHEQIAARPSEFIKDITSLPKNPFKNDDKIRPMTMKEFSMRLALDPSVQKLCLESDMIPICLVKELS